MKTIHIKRKLKEKFNDWVSSIEDEALRKRVEEGAFITGGCIASMLIGEKVRDYDIYFTDLMLAADIARYYLARFEPQLKAGIHCKMWVDVSPALRYGPQANDGSAVEQRVRIVIKSAGIASEDGTAKPYQYFESSPEGEAGEYAEAILTDATVTIDPGEIQDIADDLNEKIRTEEEEEGAKRGAKSKDKKPYRPIFMTSNAITLSSGMQLVLRFYGSPSQIHENFDFVHCMNVYVPKDDRLIFREDALLSLITKELRYVGSRYPVCSLFRIRKFIDRDWVVNAGQILKAALQISRLDLHDIAVLQDQLIGVDAAYFVEVINEVQKRKTSEGKIETAYLVEIIDRLF